MTKADSLTVVASQVVYIVWGYEKIRILCLITPRHNPEVSEVRSHIQNSVLFRKMCARNERKLTIKGMGKGIAENQKHRARIEYERGPTQSCTLLVPEYLMEKFHSQTRRFGGSVRKYLVHVLHRYRGIHQNERMPRPRKLTAQYQAVGQELQKVPLRVMPADWHELGLLARMCGFSICHFFVFLLILESAENRERNDYFKSEYTKELFRLIFTEIRIDSTFQCFRALKLIQANPPP